MDIIWVLVNCNSKSEAEKIGDTLLNNRLISCYDVFPRLLSKYFWPPLSGKTESAKGALLIIETNKEKYISIKNLLKKIIVMSYHLLGIYLSTELIRKSNNG